VKNTYRQLCLRIYPSPSSLFRSREDAPFAPTLPSGDRPLFTSAVSSVVMDHLPRPKGPRREAPPLRRRAPRIVGSSTQYGFQPAPTAIATAARLASAYMILRMCPLLLHPSPSTASTGRRLRAAARPSWLRSRADVAS
jgi:hypothetical protein